MDKQTSVRTKASMQQQQQQKYKYIKRTAQYKFTHQMSDVGTECGQ
jgi:hypothetical protein